MNCGELLDRYQKLVNLAAEIDFGGGKSIYTDGSNWYVSVDGEEMPHAFESVFDAAASLGVIEPLPV